MRRIEITPFSRRRWCSVAAAALLGLHRMARATPLAGQQDGAWLDSARGRQLPWRLRLPSAPGPWPLVLYSHGLGGNREGAAVWGQAWADAGSAVLHLQHPGSDTDTLRNGLAALRAAASAEQLLARVLDVRFALDEVERQAGAGAGGVAEPWRSLRLDAIGLAGHSFGAQTTQAVAGQRFPAAADVLALADPRLRAFIALSPSSPRDGRMTVAQAFGAITRPFLAVTGSLDGDPFGLYDSGEPRARVFDGLPRGQRALLWLQGADHMSFGGSSARPVPAVGPFRRHGPAASLEAVHRAVVARVTALWWRAQLLGDADARAALHVSGVSGLSGLSGLSGPLGLPGLQLGLGDSDRFTID